MARSTAAQPGRDAISSPVARSAPHLRVLLGHWELIAGILGILGFMAAYWTPVADFDYWYHLADGRYIVAMHALPVPDLYSFTAAGRSWVAHEWLAEVAMYLLHRLFGDAGPLALFGLCEAAMALLTMSTLRRLGTRLLTAGFWTLVMIVAVWPLIGPRPQMPAFAFLAAEIWLLERWIVRRDRSIWLLPALLCLWVNVHGSWTIGVAVPALLLGGDTLAAAMQWQGAVRLDRAARLQLGAALAVSLAALLINANGIAGLLYPVKYWHSALQDRIGGNGPTALTDPLARPFFFLAGAYLTMVAVRRPRLPAADLLSVAFFIAAALWSWRLAPFAAIFLVPQIGRITTLPNESGLRTPGRLLAKAGAWCAEQEHRPPALMRQMIYGVILLALTAIVVQRPPYDVAQAGRQPVAAVDALGADGLSGPLFNHDTWGGYLIWRLWPRVHVFMDDRGVDLYAQGDVLRQYLHVMDGDPNAEAVLDTYGIRTILVPKDWPPVQVLVASGKWQITYHDSVAVKLERMP